MNPNCKNWYREIKRIKHLLDVYKTEYATALETADFAKCKELKHQLKTAIEKLDREASLKHSLISRIRRVGLRHVLEMLVEESSYKEAKSLAKLLSPGTDLPTYREIVRKFYRLSDQEFIAIARIKQPGLVIVPPGSLQDLLKSAQKSSLIKIGERDFSPDYKPSLPSTNATVCVVDMDPNPDEISDQIPIMQNNDQQYDICRNYLNNCRLRLPKDTEYLVAGLFSIQRFLRAEKEDPKNVKPESIILDHFSSSKPTSSFIDNGTEDEFIYSADITSIPYRFYFASNSKSDNSAYLRARPVFDLIT